MVFEWSKLGLKQARTIEFTEFPFNWAICNYWTGSLEPWVESQVSYQVRTGQRVGLQWVKLQPGPFNMGLGLQHGFSGQNKKAVRSGRKLFLGVLKKTWSGSNDLIQ